MEPVCELVRLLEPVCELERLLVPVWEFERLRDVVGVQDFVCVDDAEKDTLAVMVGLRDKLLDGLPQYPNAGWQPSPQ